MSADYAALAIQLNSLSGTIDAKIAAINVMTVARAQPATINPNKIFNALVPADLTAIVGAGVTGTNKLLLMLCALQAGNGSVDASQNTTTRSTFQAIFAGTPSLANLASLVAPFDSATIPWWQAKGFPNPIDYGDVKVALNIPETSSP